MIIPAWPILGALNLAVTGGLVLGYLATLPPRPPPVDERLAVLDIPQAESDVGAAIAAADSGRALSAEDEERALMFLKLLALSAELDVRALSLLPGPTQDATQAIDATLELSGDPFHLPIFLDGLQRQRAVNHVVSVKARGGVRGEYSVLVRYYRPAAVETDWIPERLAADADLPTEAGPLLEQAAVLAVWRRFQWEERSLVERAARIRERISRELAAPLIDIRGGGGTIFWDESQGARML